MDTTAAAALPFTAWEQAAILCIFIVFVGALLAWFSRQSDKWQKFMFDIDEKWRSANKEQRAENNKATNEVREAVSDLATVTQGLVSEVREMRESSLRFYEGFESHDKQARDILNGVNDLKQKSAAGNRLTKPRGGQ